MSYCIVSNHLRPKRADSALFTNMGFYLFVRVILWMLKCYYFLESVIIGLVIRKVGGGNQKIYIANEGVNKV